MGATRRLIPTTFMTSVKLAQNQVWQQGSGYLRIVHLERLEVQFKSMKNLLAGDGQHHHVSKKEFCRLIKGAQLLTNMQVRALWQNEAVEQPALDGGRP